MVRAKFKVTGINRSTTMVRSGVKEDGTQVWVNGELQTVKLQPVYANNDSNHENSKFWEATPSGVIELGMVNPAAVAEFELGAEIYVDFTPAE